MKEISIRTPFSDVQEKVTFNNYLPEATCKNKSGLEEMSPYCRINSSEEIICDISNLNMPVPVAQIVQVIKNRYPAIAINSIINIVHAKIAQMFTAKRIKYLEIGKAGYPNYYSTLFMPSGMGKDRISNELDEYVFFPFKNWFKNAVLELKQNRKLEIEQQANIKFPDEKQTKAKELYIKEKIKEFRNMTIEVSDGTREGIYYDAKVFKEAGFGSLMIKFAELGQYLNKMTSEQTLFFNILFEAYDGKIISKSIKTEQRQENIEDIPVNTLMYSDPTLFKGSSLEKIFNLLMEAGLGRRCIITFMDKKEPYKIEKNAKEALKQEKQYYQDLKALGEKLYEIFESVQFKNCYELLEDTNINVFYPYKVKLDELENQTVNTLLQKEIKSRELKALKIACMYACINHPQECYINTKDMEMAIETTERLSKDFYSFIRYRPSFEDKYDRMLQFFLENEGKYFSKTELMTNHRQKFGYSRDKFIKNFENDMAIVADMAKSENYTLEKRLINNNSGTEYRLVHLETKELSSGVKELGDLI